MEVPITIQQQYSFHIISCKPGIHLTFIIVSGEKFLIQSTISVVGIVGQPSLVAKSSACFFGESWMAQGAPEHPDWTVIPTNLPNQKEIICQQFTR